jgi:hypothetical protein
MDWNCEPHGCLQVVTGDPVDFREMQLFSEARTLAWTFRPDSLQRLGTTAVKKTRTKVNWWFGASFYSSNYYRMLSSNLKLSDARLDG